MRLQFTLLLVVGCMQLLWATTDKYRCVLRGNPSTTMTIGWNQVNGSNTTVYYDVVDHGTNTAAYAFSRGVDRAVTAKGMDNNFCRLTGLQANTVYYFVIEDNNSTSARFSFRTAPDVPTERLSMIAGGDSRNNRTPRQNANRIVAKTRPHAVLFGGDMTNGDTNGEWSDWFDDWQYTTGTDGRMTPIIAARGNHENSNASVHDLFDTPSSDVYYAVTFGGNLYRPYTLNSMLSVSGSQKTWLENDLQANQSVIWKSAQYHHPMRPHVASKSERNDMVTHWAPLFETLGVAFAVECDAHTVKTTHPIRTSSAPGSDEGFIRDDDNGVVYVGEGCWGAPLRSNNDSKSWSRSGGSFNQVKWIFISEDTIEIRTIRVDNAQSVGNLTDATRFNMPSGIDIWNPAPGDDVVYITKKEGVPSATLYNPLHGQTFMGIQPIQLEAIASDTDGVVTAVEFYVNNTLVGTDNSAPYGYNWTPSSGGQYLIYAKAIDDDGKTGSSNAATITVHTNITTVTATVNQSSDDAEERSNGGISLTSSDLEMVDDIGLGHYNQVVGLRFSSLNVPAGAVITNAYIQFTCDETSSSSTNLTIAVEDEANAATFASTTNNITNRTTFGTTVTWNSIPAWNSTGASNADHRTPNLTALVQHVVNKGGWSTGNPIAFVLQGSGRRIAESYDGTAPAQLVVEYQNGGLLSGTLDVQIGSGSDDAEERAAGNMYLNSSDIELVYDGGGNQTVGLRFNNISLPAGATMTSAYIQFGVDETNSGTTNLNIFIQDDVNPATFGSANNDISSRPTMPTSVAWSPPAWSTTGATGTNQRTPDLKGLLQTVFNKAGWAAGNSVAFIITGTGERTAEAFEGDASRAARLIINYTYNLPAAVAPMVADAGFCPGSSATLDGGAGYAQYFWNDDIQQLQGQLLNVNTAGSYVLRAMDTHGQVTSDTSIVTAYAAPMPSLGADQNLNGGAVTFGTANTYTSYLWSTGETSQSISTSTPGTYTVTVTDINGCTATDIVEAINNVLSINSVLLEFHARLEGKQVQTHWVIEEDNKTSHFVLERSVDAIVFSELSTIDNHKEGERRYYQYNDANPLVGMSYYRLKQVYHDGTFHYSSIKAIENNPLGGDWANLYPNPAVDYVTVEMDIDAEQLPVAIQIWNTMGQLVHQGTYTNSNVRLNIDELPAGRYVVRVQTAKQVLLTKNLIIQ